MTKPPNPTFPTLDHLIAASSASERFAAELKILAERGTNHNSISFNAGCPPVKVRRAICQLLEQFPDLPVHAVEVEGRSGCSDFRGTLTARTAEGAARRFQFVWDCAWKAETLGWKTFWGDPDQQRAARELDFQCFEVFEEIT